jgi:F-type H+-transporting ATPase subunit b
VLIDWFTIIAQIINFLILLFLLRRFLYRPILNAMEAREQRVAALLDEAEKKRTAAEQERERFEAKNKELQEHSEQRRREIESSLESWRKDALHDARKEVDTILQNWHKTIEDDKADFYKELSQFAVRQTYTIAHKAIQDLAGADLETMMIHRFLEKMRQQEIQFDPLTEGSEDDFAASAKLRSAFPLSIAQQEQLKSRLQDQFRKKVHLKFETEPHLLSGIEIVWDTGYAAAWNLRRYLDTLEDMLDQQMSQDMDERSVASSQVEV